MDILSKRIALYRRDLAHTIKKRIPLYQRRLFVFLGRLAALFRIVFPVDRRHKKLAALDWIYTLSDSRIFLLAGVSEWKNEVEYFIRKKDRQQNVFKVLDADY